jgi:hypothetical protein
MRSSRQSRSMAGEPYPPSLPLQAGEPLRLDHSSVRPVNAYQISNEDYQHFFHIWLRYNQYRKQLLLNRIDHVVIVTDIANYFDSIQHSLLFDCLAQYGLPREVTGILGKLLDVLRPRAGHSPTPHVGLPVDFYDCSRPLAHVFLFEHDRHMIAHAGGDNYVRWMDDQTIIVPTATRARRTVRRLVQSLNRHRLTLNSGKTKFLSPADVERTFHLQTNDEVDVIEQAKSPQDLGGLHVVEAELSLIYSRLTSREGHWDKVAKRVYAQSMRFELDFLTYDQCFADLLDAPLLAERIFEYLAVRGRWKDLVDIFSKFIGDRESIYENVEIAWFEAILSNSPPAAFFGRIKKCARSFLASLSFGSGCERPRALAALALYWVSDKRSLKSLFSYLDNQKFDQLPEVRRTIAAVLFAREERGVDVMLRASRQPSARLSSLIDFLDRIRAGDDIQLPRYLVPYKQPPHVGHRVYDAHVWLRLELLSHSTNAKVRDRVLKEAKDLGKYPIGSLGGRIAKRILARVRKMA